MELNLQEFTAIRKKIVQNMGEIKYFTKCIKNMIFSLLISEIWNLFILAHLDQLKKGKKLNDKNLWSIFLINFLVTFCQNLGPFTEKWLVTVRSKDYLSFVAQNIQNRPQW